MEFPTARNREFFGRIRECAGMQLPAPGKSGLTKTPYALIDHLRSIDKRRIRGVLGCVADEEMTAIDQGLELFLGLDGEP